MRKKEQHRPGFEDIVWFRMPLGRQQNAEPRWIMPLICRRGHVTRNEIGAIRISQNETHFQIPRAMADRFAEAAARTAQNDQDEDPVAIERSDSGPREAAKGNRKFARNGAGKNGPRVNPKPGFKSGKKPAGKPGGKFKAKDAKAKNKNAAKPFSPNAKGSPSKNPTHKKRPPNKS